MQLNVQIENSKIFKNTLRKLKLENLHAHEKLQKKSNKNTVKK